MEITLEQVEKLRARAELSYEEARALLEKCGGSVLDALIALERQGKAPAPEDGGAWQSGQTPPEDRDRLPVRVVTGSGWETFWTDFKCLLGQAWEVLRHLPDYRLAIRKKDRTAAALPLWAALALLLVVFRVTAPLAILGLFLGYRYRIEKEE